MPRKRRRRNPQSVYLACAALLGATCLLYWGLSSRRLAWNAPGKAPAANRVDPMPLLPAAIRTPSRAIYPYSVIRGGAYSVAEFDAALRADSVAAAHYAVFDRTRTHIAQAPAAYAPVYVSYRQDDRVYWTRRQVRLAANEPLLSDGVYAARARCGNRISLTPQDPTQAREPSAAELDRAEPPVYAAYGFIALPGPPELALLPELADAPPLPGLRRIDGATLPLPLPPVDIGYLWMPPILLPGVYPAGVISGQPLGGIAPLPFTTSGPTFQPATGIVPPSQVLLPPNTPIPFAAEIPEPATAALLLCGAAILARRRFSSRRLR